MATRRVSNHCERNCIKKAGVNPAFFFVCLGRIGVCDWVFARIPEFQLEIPTWA